MHNNNEVFEDIVPYKHAICILLSGALSRELRTELIVRVLLFPWVIYNYTIVLQIQTVMPYTVLCKGSNSLIGIHNGKLLIPLTI